MQINILNNNGIISVYGSNPVPNSYFGGSGKSGKVYPHNGDRFLIMLGGDAYDVLWTDLLVNNLAPTDYGNAYTLLGQIFSAAPPPVTPLAIGDFYQGGIIFYLDGSGQHGLIRALDSDIGYTDINSYYAWIDSVFSVNTILTNANGTAIGTGKSNTDLILLADPASQAARYCVDYSGGGYADWYLPSADEISALYNSGLYPDLTFWPYAWTSTEADLNNAYVFDSYYVTMPPVPKGSPANVIPIRTF